MNKREAHKEAMYLIKNNIDNWNYDVARGVAELAHGIAIITDKEYENVCNKIEKAREKI